MKTWLPGVSALIFFGVFYTCVNKHPRIIQEDLAVRIEPKLKRAGLDAVRSRLEGYDVVLESGEAPESTVRKAQALIQTVWGVRRVYLDEDPPTPLATSSSFLSLVVGLGPEAAEPSRRRDLTGVDTQTEESNN